MVNLRIVSLHPEAKEQLEKIESEKSSKIRNRLNQIQDKPNPENSKLIEVKNRTVYSLKMKDDGLDHRAIYDIKPTEVIIYTIFHRDFGYNKDKIARRF